MSEANTARILIADDEPLYSANYRSTAAQRGFSLHDRAEWLCGIGGTFSKRALTWCSRI